MSITFATSFADIGKIAAAFVNINGICGATSQVYAYLFTVTAVTTAPTVGATYTNNGITYTVIATVAATGTMVAMVGTGPPTTTGTLTKTSGTGDATLTFSANVPHPNWIAANVSAVTTSPVGGASAAVYTNNSITYTVIATVSGTGTTISLYGNGVPTQSATLTKVSGTGDATLTVTSITGSYLNWNAVTGAQTSYSGPAVKCQGLMVSDILTRLEGAGLTSLIPYNSWQQTIVGIDTQLSSQKQALQALAQQVLILRVNNDVKQQDSTSFTQAIVEWIRQMQVGSSTVQSATVSASTSAGSNNTGTATVYASLIDLNGLTLEYSFAESIVLKCIEDRFTGATAGSETLSIISPYEVADQLSYLWPNGSGLNTTTVVNDPTQGYGSGGNLIGGGASTVGAFKAWTVAVPNGWVVVTDAANISDGTSNNYSGTAHCLALTGNTGGTNLNTQLYQAFANGGITSGSTVELLPQTVYQLYAKVKADVVPAAGAVQFSLVDGSNVVVTNNAGAANTITSTISSFGSTAYQTVTGTFQTPSVMPTNIRLSVKVSTKITTGSIVYIDFACLSQPSAQGNGYGGEYAGGPYIGVYRGSTDIINYASNTVGDRWTVAVANNYGGSSATILSFNMLFNQLFGMNDLGYILPTSSTPSISDALIS